MYTNEVMVLYESDVTLITICHLKCCEKSYEICRICNVDVLIMVHVFMI
jgi:hypothetical protein